MAERHIHPYYIHFAETVQRTLALKWVNCYTVSCSIRTTKRWCVFVKEECLICKAPLVYLNEDIEMECELCHKKENSKTRCVNGHYVCNECHMQGVDSDKVLVMRTVTPIKFNRDVTTAKGNVEVFEGDRFVP